MKRMWSPWRSAYLETFKDPPKKSKSRKSIFIRALEENDDDKHFIVHRGKHCFVILNLYPYNSGHLMVVPYKQTGRFDRLSDAEIAEAMKLVRISINALDKNMKPEGFNFGANLGRVAGAGVKGHVHFHIVPRWNGDTNFMPVLSDTKVISEDMRTTMLKLRRAFKQADGIKRKKQQQNGSPKR
ncbi:MAG: HIT domain-containing protein [Bacteroidetes bacterium]|nr:HIT domain-containing protein [Bacteroidota bacterium]MCW5895169.1 HIT domain-containing protein [Bacteroidota bacterium]